MCCAAEIEKESPGGDAQTLSLILRCRLNDRPSGSGQASGSGVTSRHGEHTMRAAAPGSTAAQPAARRTCSSDVAATPACAQDRRAVFGVVRDFCRRRKSGIETEGHLNSIEGQNNSSRGVVWHPSRPLNRNGCPITGCGFFRGTPTVISASIGTRGACLVCGR